MEQIRATKIIRNGTSLSVTIPKEILRALKMERGDQVLVRIFDERSFVVSKLSFEEIRKLNSLQ